MQRAEAFYALQRDSGDLQSVAYHPDTEGVLDIAHMLWGDEIFCDFIDPSRRSWWGSTLAPMRP